MPALFEDELYMAYLHPPDWVRPAVTWSELLPIVIARMEYGRSAGCIINKLQLIGVHSARLTTILYSCRPFVRFIYCIFSKRIQRNEKSGSIYELGSHRIKISKEIK